MKNKNAFRKKLLHNGVYSIFLSLAVIAVLVVLNFLVSALPASIRSLDFSEQKMFSISDQTKKLVRGLDEDVTLYFVVQSGKEDAVIEDLLARYADLSKHIKIQKIDPAVHPTFASAYTSEGIGDNSIVVESGKRFQLVFNDSIYVTKTGYDSEGNEVEAQDFEGESALTSAIDYVTNDALSVIYCLNGHSEKAFSDRLRSYIARENMEMNDLSLVSTGEVPADCGCLLINAPEKDISEKEKDLILAYLNRGGTLFYIRNYMLADCPNLDAVTGQFGIGFDSSMVFEGNAGFTYGNAPYQILANFKTHEVTQPLIDHRMYCIVPYAMRIVTDHGAASCEVSPLLTTTASGYAKSLEKELKSMEREPEDEKGTMILAAASQNTENHGKMVVLSSMNFLDEEVSGIVSDGNYDFAINAVGWMCEHESSIAIHSKSLSGDALNISSSQANGWGIVLTGVLPVLIIAAGVVIWIIRRRK